MENLKDLQADEATAKIGTGSAVIKYYREARAALSYPPVMTLDTGGEYPTSHIVQAGTGDLHTLVPKKSTAIPLPDDLRPTSDDWQPIAEVTPSATAIDCGGFAYPGPQGSTIVTQPKTVQIAWDGAIKCHLCRLPYSPLKSWPWRRWFGGARPMFLAARVQTSPQGGEVITVNETSEEINCDIDYSKATQPYIVGGEGGLAIEDNGAAYPYAVRWRCGRNSFVLPMYNYDTIGVEEPTHTFDILFPMRDGTATIYLLMFCRITYAGKSKPIAASPREGEWTYSRLTWAQRYGMLAGFGLKSKFAIAPSSSLCVFTITFDGLSRPAGATHIRFSFLEPPMGRNSLYFAGSFEQPPLNPYTGNYAPFVRTLRHDLLSLPANRVPRGRLTDMTQPACSYGIVLHWWTEDGKSYALPFKAVAVERSASVVSETRRDGMAADLLSSGREQYNTMRGESLTRYRCAMELDEDEQRAAATLAESPFFCYTTAEDEDTRHWCEVDGVKTEWTATEAATIELTIRDI